MDNLENTKLRTSTEGQNLLGAYEWFRNPEVLNSMKDAALEVAADLPRKEARVLGIGSGTGIVEKIVVEALKEKGVDASLILSDILSEGFKSGNDNLAKILMDNKEMPIKDESVDIVVARSVTHYENNLEDEEKVLTEINRILINGGYFLTQAPSPELKSEAELLRNMHILVNKEMNVQQSEDTTEMLKRHFKSVKEADHQSSQSLTVNKEAFLSRYQPKRDSCKNEEEYNEKIKKLTEVTEQIINLIHQTPEEERPHIIFYIYKF